MKTLINLFVIAIMTFCFSACSNDTEPVVSENPTPYGIKVENQSKYIPGLSRAADDKQILVFPDETSYQSTLNMLADMSEDERNEYFKTIGFEGAYSIRNQADKELDALFDDEKLDSCEFNHEIDKLIERYDGLLSFNKREDCKENEELDVTPGFKFSDKDLQLVGSVDGYVVVGNEIKSAQSNLSRATVPDPIDTSIIKTCEVCVNHGKYKSYLSIGRKGIYFAFKVQTYRKKNFATKHDNDCIHYGTFEISDTKGVLGVRVQHKRGEYSLPPYEVKAMDLKLKVVVTDFYDSKHPDEKVSKTFTDVIFK
ncbi:MAG: DUF4848 domain-containing protein [Bacteroides sp.]|nr:DUF4848 domain-containing protein [Bacteroides sp.]